MHHIGTPRAKEQAASDIKADILTIKICYVRIPSSETEIGELM